MIKKFFCENRAVIPAERIFMKFETSIFRESVEKI